MRVADDAAPAAERDDRRGDQFRKFKNFVAGINGAAADKSHRRHAIRNQRSGGQAASRSRRVRHSTGSFDPTAVSSEAPALSTAGPGTTLNTPGFPLDRA